ncbi:hypothetical protein EGW08_004990, partial [Elysia chlorotica]
LIEVVKLKQYTYEDYTEQGVGEPVLEFVVASGGCLDSYSDTLAAHHGKRTQSGTDGHIHQDVLLTVAGGEVDNHHARHQHDCHTINNKTWRQNNSLFLFVRASLTWFFHLDQQILHIVHLLLLRAVYDHDGGAQNTQHAAYLAQNVQALFQHSGCKNGT